jgi:hypothetical protein
LDFFPVIKPRVIWQSIFEYQKTGAAPQLPMGTGGKLQLKGVYTIANLPYCLLLTFWPLENSIDGVTRPSLLEHMCCLVQVAIPGM